MKQTSACRLSQGTICADIAAAAKSASSGPSSSTDRQIAEARGSAITISVVCIDENAAVVFT
jgi:hypothetical protein